METTNNTPTPGGAPAPEPGTTSPFWKTAMQNSAAEKPKWNRSGLQPETTTPAEIDGQSFEGVEPDVEDDRETVGIEGGYDLKVSAELPPDLAPEVREQIHGQIAEAGLIGRELGISQDVVQDFSEVVVSLAVQDQSGVSLENKDACVNVLRTRYGATGADAIIRDAQAAAKQLGPRTMEYLDATDLGNSPAVLFALAQYRAGLLHLSPEAAQQKLNEITSPDAPENLRRAYMSSSHADHQFIKDTVGLLYQRASRKGSGVDRAQKNVAKKAEAKVTADQKNLDRRIKEAIADPAYRDSNHPKHKEAVDRATALYDLRYRDE